MTDLHHPAPALAKAPLPRRLSVVLSDLVAHSSERVSLGDLVTGLRDRSFAPLMVLFAAPNVFLYIPGSSMFTGFPLMLLALQLIAGRPSVWLPRFLAERSIEHQSFARIVLHSTPWVVRIERLARPRLWAFAPRLIEQVIGVVTFLLALILFLPIPFANGVPALAIICFGLAMSERDGVWLMAGLAFAGTAITIVGTLFAGGAFALGKFFL